MRKEALQSVSTNMPYYDDDFQRPMMTCLYRFNYTSREALTTNSYEQNLIGPSLHDMQPLSSSAWVLTSIYQQNLIGLSPFNVRALPTWIMQFNINCALPSGCESTISSAAISMRSVKVQCQGGLYAQPPYMHEALNASVSFKYVTYMTYTSKFKTPSIRTTTTLPVYYYYEFHELSSIRLPMIIAFTIMVTACILHLIVAHIQTFQRLQQPRCTNNDLPRRLRSTFDLDIHITTFPYDTAYIPDYISATRSMDYTAFRQSQQFRRFCTGSSQTSPAIQHCARFCLHGVYYISYSSSKRIFVSF